MLQGHSLILLVIIGINVLVSYKGFTDPNFIRKYYFHIGSIRAGEQIRMFSSAFLHADWQHLIFNMVTLYFFGPTVLYKLGDLGFMLVYFVSLASGSLLTLYMNRNNYNYTALGASGAVMGVVFSGILINPDAEINFIIPAWLFGIGYLLFSIYGMRAKRDNIGHHAHFGGAIGGYVITLCREPELFSTEPLLIAGLALPIVILFVMDRMGKL
ncbi:rhomboid family intramembrane serine protease [Flavobacterium sp. RHBU_3]|uniref:rhomboid family intramembrane serine protease n=1 Tax=Flavobacterium sp. RHBU_3 TaxID=3391184 RepID=UPI0039846C47